MYNLIVSYTGETTAYNVYTGTTNVFSGATIVLSDVTAFPVTIGGFDVNLVYVFLKTEDCDVQILSYSNTVPTPTPTSSVTGSLTPTPTISPTNTITPSRTPTRTPPPTVTGTVTPTLTPSASVTPSVTPSVSITRSLTPSVTASKTPATTPTLTPTSSHTPVESASATVTPTLSATPTLTPSPSVVCNRFQITALELFESINVTFYNCYLLREETITVYNGTPVVVDCAAEGSFVVTGGSYQIDNLGGCTANVSATPTQTPTVTSTMTPTRTPTISITPTHTVTPTNSLSMFVTPSPSAPSSGCTCPSGYTPTIDGSRCVKTQTQGATSPTSGDTLTGRTFSSYGNFGTVIYSTYNVDGTYIAAPTTITTPFWSNTGSTTTNGPLNRVGVWTAVPQSNQDIGFSVCFNVAHPQTFYIGMGADNSCRVTLDGTTILNQDASALATQFGTDTQVTFKYWHVYPVTMQAGRHIIEVIGHNVGSAAAVGFEIYNNTAAQISGATSYADLTLQFSSVTKVGQPVELGNNGVGYTCPAGWSLVTCDGAPYCQLVDYTNCIL
jgi:hypothetical protein